MQAGVPTVPAGLAGLTAESLKGFTRLRGKESPEGLVEERNDTACKFTFVST